MISKYNYANEALYASTSNIFKPQPKYIFSLYGLNVKKRKIHLIAYSILIRKKLNNNFCKLLF